MSRRSFSFLLVQAALMLVSFAAVACSSTDESTTDPFEQNVPNYDKRANLLDLETADETQEEILRLLNDGYVMYMRIEIFNKRVFPERICFEYPEHPGSIPNAVCESNPARIVREIWESVDPSGTVSKRYSRESTADGELLAFSYPAEGEIRGQWTHIATGETWPFNPGDDFSPATNVEGISGTEARIREYENVIDGEYMGRPSIVVPEGEFEYQLANPFLMRQTRWREHDDGTVSINSEIKVVDVAMLPPDSFPNHPETVSNR